MREFYIQQDGAKQNDYIKPKNKERSIREYRTGDFFVELCTVKAVVDIDKELLAVNAELYSDLEGMLLQQGANQSSLYGINIYYD